MRAVRHVMIRGNVPGNVGWPLHHWRTIATQPLVRYIGRRLAISAIVLVGISFVSFATVYLLPGDPVTSRFPDLGASEREGIRAAMGLDQPLPVQYWRYLTAVLHGDFGFSYNTGSPVISDLKMRVPATLELAFFGALLGIPIGLGLGILAAVYRDRWLDYGVRMLSIGTLSVPSFWMGVVGIYLFFYVLKWVPSPIGRLPLTVPAPPSVTGLLTVDSLLAGDWATFLSALRSLALPAVVLGLSLVAPIMRMTRSALSEALQEDYVTFARAVGVQERDVVMRDALRGAMVAIVTIIGYLLGHSLGGAALVETVFAWPGVGRYAVDAVITSDMAPINAVLLIGAVSIALTNLVVDLSHALLDPRIRHGVVEG